MRSKLLNQSASARAWMLVFDDDDDVLPTLLAFAREQKISGASVMGIGGFHDVTLAFFDLQKKEYMPIPIHEQVEVMSLLGNIGRQQAETKLHLHCIVGKRDGSAHGGHLLAARVRPTLELFVTETGGSLERALDPKTGLPLLVP